MAYSILPRPGSRLGPCVPLCAHNDCRSIREQALWACSYCGRPVGYEVPWFVEEGSPAHLVCAQRSEEEQNARPDPRR